MNLDFLPVRNIDEAADVAIGGMMAAVPVGKFHTNTIDHVSVHVT